MGAGASALVMDLVQRGYRSIDAVDLSQAALDQLRRRLGSDADTIRCHCADVREVHFDGPVDVWHDRATFHFLTTPDDRAAYVQRVLEAVPSGGHVVLATFSEAGPEQCSGLPVARCSGTGLCELFGESFELVDSFESEHTTPWGAPQAFTHVLLRRR
jgi:SAM-dependent methyltransferase